MSSADKLTIETPEQTSLEFPLAGIGSRFLAMLADKVVQFVGAGVLLLLAALFFPTLRLLGLLVSAGAGGREWIFAAIVLGFFLIDSGYFAFFESVWNGQTPGKRYTKIRVIKDDGRPITTYDAIARNLLRTVDELPGVYGVGVISILFSAQNKRLGDYLAGTVVVHDKTVEGAHPFPEKQQDANSLAHYDVSRITLDELHLMEAFFQRRDSLDPDLRASMATQIANRIGQSVGVHVVGWPETERFLESAYEQFRSVGRLQSKN